MRAHDVTEGGDASSPQPKWAQILVDAVEKPGIISQAYSRFWSFSIGNQLLAIFECMSRGIEPGPIHTFRGWIDLGRRVRRGERAISLVMPITVKRRKKDALPAEPVRVGDGAERQLTGPGGEVTQSPPPSVATIFKLKPHWFVLSQTEGADYTPPPVAEWDEATALTALGIERMPFDHPNGNCQGFARQRSVSVSPIAALPHKTLFHELAHVLLGHTEEHGGLDDHELTPRTIREVEAESVALICCESLELGGAPECRGYIQHWLGTATIPDKSVQRIFRSADLILKSGRAVNPPAHP